MILYVFNPGFTFYEGSGCIFLQEKKTGLDPRERRVVFSVYLSVRSGLVKCMKDVARVCSSLMDEI